MWVLALRWTSCWALLLSIYTYNSLVQALNVVHLSVDWKESLPDAQVELLRRLKGRSHIQEGLYNNRTATAYGAYMANVTIGTPGQSLSLAIETGWSDTIILAATAYECNQKSWKDGDGPCYGGTFDPTKSSTFATTIPNGLDTLQGDGNPNGNYVALLGDYFTDSFGIGGAQLKGLQMGLALNSTNSTIYYGILGLGRSGKEVEISNKTTYPNFMDQLVSQSLISTKTYSLYLNSLNSITGSIIFGGIDTRKFVGDLAILNSTDDAVDMQRIVIRSSQGAICPLVNSTNAALTNLTAYFATSNVLSYVPESILQNAISYFGAVDDRNNSGLVLVDCGKLTTEAGTTFEFDFGRYFGPSIIVPISDMILPLSYIFGSKTNPLTVIPFANTCLLGITGLNLDYSSNSFCSLGNTFLRSAYLVVDLDRNQTAMAQSVNEVSDSNIVEISASGTGIPSVYGVSPSSTSTSSSGTATAAGTPESNTKSKGISSGAIAGIVVGVVIVLGAIGILAFICFRRRSTERRAVPLEPARQIEELPTNNNAHEIPGKDHEIETKELPTQDNKHEFPDAGIDTVKRELPSELQNQVQHNNHELLGSINQPAEVTSATYSPVSDQLGYGAISPEQFDIASVPELPAEPMQRKPLPALSPVSPISRTSVLDPGLPNLSSPGAEPGGSSNSKSLETGPSKVDILQQRLERVRAEKDRLAKLGELEEMEAALQQEIMAEFRKDHASEGR